MQIDDPNRLVNERRRRGADVVKRDGADVAEVLGDDHIGPAGFQSLELDLVDREGVVEDGAHLTIDFTAGPGRP